MSTPDTLVDIRTQCETILSLTEAMLASARDGEWTRAVELEATRRAKLGTLFPVNVAPEGAAALLGHCAEQIQAMDREIQSIGAIGRAELSRNMARLNRGHRAHKAYQANGG